MRLFKKHKSNNEKCPLYQNKKIWMLNNSFQMFVHCGDKVISKLILLFLSFYKPGFGIGIYLTDLTRLMYPKYKNNHAYKYKKTIKAVLNNYYNNFLLNLGKGRMECLFKEITYSEEDGLYTVLINEKIIPEILYDERRFRKDFDGFFVIETYKINNFDSRSHFISLWLYTSQLTNNGYCISKYKIWKDDIYRKVGIDENRNYPDFNRRVFKPALEYILSVETEWECDLDDITMRRTCTRQYLLLSIKVPKRVEEKKPKVEINEDSPEFMKSFLKKIK